MDTPQNETPQDGTPQNETPQNGPTQESQHPIRDGIIGIIVILFVLIFLANLCSDESSDDESNSQKEPVAASAHELAVIGKNAANQPVILYGMVGERTPHCLFFFPTTEEETKDSQIVYCCIEDDVRTRHIKALDVVTISGYAEHDKNNKIGIRNCQFHGYGNIASEVKEEWLRKNSK